MKKHWTQTYDGRKKMPASMKKSWAKRKRSVKKIDKTFHDGTFKINGSLSTRIHQATTVEQLAEIKEFLDLKDELLARLP